MATPIQSISVFPFFARGTQKVEIKCRIRAILMSGAGDQTTVTVSPIITNTLTNAICQMTSLFRFSWRAFSLSVPGQNQND